MFKARPDLIYPYICAMGNLKLPLSAVASVYYYVCAIVYAYRLEHPLSHQP